MISRGEIETLDSNRRIYRATQLFRSPDSFRARTTNVSLCVPKSLQRIIASECTQRPMRELGA
jgi:hypothetical protein